MESCIVCGSSLAQFDEDSRAHHVNMCLDGRGPSGSSAGGLQSEPTAASHSSSHSMCPICDDHLPLPLLQDHVEACLAKNIGGGDDGIPSLSENANACPSCFITWTDIDCADGKDAHAIECLSQQKALAEQDEHDSPDNNGSDNEDDLDVVDENGNKIPLERLRTMLGTSRIVNVFGKMKTNARQDPLTPGLIPQLALLLESAFEHSGSGANATRSAVLSTSHTVHIKSQVADFGWGCGYKNAQIVFSALRHVGQYRNLFSASGEDIMGAENAAQPIERTKRKSPSNGPDEAALPDIPSILQLQNIAEMAWSFGFDPAGSRHFGGKLVNSRKWIGTSEVYTMFTWLGIRCTVIDFPKATGPDGMHTALIRWVFDYFNVSFESGLNGEAEQKSTRSHTSPEEKPFSNAFNALMDSGGSPVRIAEEKMPLYLQHSGHSRTIVGVEVTRSGQMNLVLFDPSQRIAPELRASARASVQQDRFAVKKVKMENSISGRNTQQTLSAGGRSISADYVKHLQPFKVNLKSLSRKKEYQILRIETHGGPLTADEKLQRRIITSQRVT